MGKMRDRFFLYFDTMPKSTAQQKRYNGRTGHFYKSKTLTETERKFFCALKSHAPETPSEKPIELHIWFYFDIKEKSKWGKPKVSKPDVDNYSKAFIDQMVKCGFFTDDSIITNLHIEKYYAEKASIVVEWQEVEE